MADARSSSEPPEGVMVVETPFTVRVNEEAELMFWVLGSVTGVEPAGLSMVV